MAGRFVSSCRPGGSSKLVLLARPGLLVNKAKAGTPLLANAADVVSLDVPPTPTFGSPQGLAARATDRRGWPVARTDRGLSSGHAGCAMP